jgi:hypothetical protein
MTDLFKLTDSQVALVEAILKLDELAGGGKIVLSWGIRVETQDDGLKLILSQMMMANDRKSLVVIERKPENISQDEIPAVVQAPSSKIKKAGLVERAWCSICGTGFTPKRSDQVLCGKKECRAQKNREYAARHALKGKGIDLAKDSGPSSEASLGEDPLGMIGSQPPTHQAQ